VTERTTFKSKANNSKTALQQYKESLIWNVVQRFTNNKALGEKFTNEDGTFRPRVVTIQAFKNKSYVIASLLDPRIKLRPFTGI
jgi:hypothetical protein